MELKKDPNLENEMKTDLFKQIFIMMAILRYDQFVRDENRVEIEPEAVVNAKREWTGDEGGKYKYVNKFLEDFEITNSPRDFTISKNIEKWICEKNLGISPNLFTRELKQYCKEHLFDLVTSKVKKVCGKNHQVWFGIKERTYCPEDEVEENEA